MKKEFLLVNEHNEIIEFSNKYIYPFYNMDVGDVFLYNYEPYMRIGAQNFRGVYVNLEVNCVSLKDGKARRLPNEQLVTLIENPWKSYSAPHLRKGLYSDAKEN